MSKQIVVVGSVNLDLVCWGNAFPRRCQAKGFRRSFGGKGANQSVAVARLGYPVSMVAKVGDDNFGGQLRQGLRAAGVNVRQVGVARNTASGAALISVDAKGQNSIMVIPGANGKLLPQDLERALPMLRSAGMLLAQLEIPMETIEYLCSIADRHKIPMMLDPAPARLLSRKLLRQVSFLTPNETETCTLCGIAPEQLSLSRIAECAAELKKKGAANLVVKLGARGAYIDSAEEPGKLVPSFKVRVVDSTAAGDAFNAGLAVALLRKMSLAEAARYATAAGAVSVTRAGAQPAMPTAEDVERLLSANHGKVNGGRRSRSSR